MIASSIEPAEHLPAIEWHADSVWLTLGDSITEGQTWPVWVIDSVGRSGSPAPRIVNAGVGGNTSAQMLARMEGDVVQEHPSLVFVQAGVNDVLQGVQASYPENISAIFDRLVAAGVPVLALTTTALGGKHASLNDELARMNDVVREQAARRKIPVVEIFDPFLDAVRQGEPVLEGDGIHVSLAGYRIMAREVLRALAPGVPLAEPFAPGLENGVLTPWMIQPTDAGKGKDPVRIALPQDGPAPNWWLDQERQRGFVVDLKRFFPGAKTFTARSTFRLEEPAAVEISVGASVETLVLDGVEVYSSRGVKRWAIRRAVRTPVLEAGEHVIEAGAGDAFFVSVVPVP